MSFIRRKIKVIFEMTPQGSTDINKYEIVDHRTIANIQTSGLDQLGQLNLQIFGLTQTVMNKLTVVALLPQIFTNTVIVMAGDADSYSQVYYGNISSSYADYTNSPDVYLSVVAKAVGALAASNDPPSHFPGQVSAIDMLRTLTGKMGINFVKNKDMPSYILSDSTYKGSYLQQAKDIMKDAGIFNNNFELNTLAIWPMGEVRDGPIALISPETGMVGYPTYTLIGVLVTTVYNPLLIFGGSVEIKSSYEPVVIPTGGQWQINSMTHTLTSEVPGGPWFTQIEAVNLKGPLATPK